eukprot:13057318-Alexandrium_andersonii.AAC.1
MHHRLDEPDILRARDMLGVPLGRSVVQAVDALGDLHDGARRRRLVQVRRGEPPPRRADEEPP